MSATVDSTKLYGYITNNPTFAMPPTSSQDIIFASISTYRSTIYQTAISLMEAGAGSAKLIKVAGGVIGEVPFAAIDILMSISSEGVLQAVVTGIAGNTTGIVIGGLIGTAIGGPGGAVTGSIIGGLIALGANKLYDGVYDYAEQIFQQIDYDPITKTLRFDTDLSNLEDMKTLIDSLKGYAEMNMLLENIYINQLIDDVSTVYMVKSGDTLWDIGQKYNMTQEKLVETNPWLVDRISDDGKYALIRHGDQITIPKDFVKPVNYNPLVENAQKQANGEVINVTDRHIPADANFPMPAAGGQIPGGTSPTAPNIIYQYTALPSSGGFFSSLFFVISTALTVVGGGLAAALSGVFSWTSVSATIVSGVNPLVIDLDGDGIETIDINKSNVYFDMNNDNFKEKVGWISGDDGFLVIDKNNNGIIDDQSEMFGSTSTKGFEDLRAYDTNNDGIIDSRDAQFGNLKIWQDKNEDGITDEGELKTLAEMGISSINLGYRTVNQDDGKNNLIAEVSSFTKTDGTTGQIGDVLFAYNKMYTIYEGDYILAADVIELPWIRGYGQVVDFQLASSNNADLLALSNELYSLNNALNIYDKIDELLALWTGADSISSTAMNGAMSAREAYIVSKFLNIEIQNVTSVQKQYIEAAYNEIKNKTFVNFIAQTMLGNAFEINYDFVNDAIVYNDNTYEKLVMNLLNQDTFIASYLIAKSLADAGALDINKLAYAITDKGFGAALIAYLNSGFEILNSEEIVITDPSKPLYVIGTNGNDIIYGTDNADIIYGMDGDDIIYGGNGDDFLYGGAGNDILYGGDGNDTLIGGPGDDELHGGYGNDTYIYDGDGKDVIIDERWVRIARQVWYQTGWWIFSKWESKWVYQDQLVDAGNDTVIFGENVKEKDVTISRIGNDLVFSLNGTNDSLTIKNWYATAEQRVENFVFADGFVINSDQILGYIKDTAGNDTMVGTNGPNYIVSESGNDIITGGKGNDAIINFEGDTIYKFNLGDGDDIIMDYAGNDKIQFGQGITVDNVKYVRRNRDLIISIKNMADTITILNWFINDNNRIETLEFYDGSKIYSSEIMSMISTTIATGYDDIIIAGNDQDNVIDGLAGDDYIEGGAGNDTLIGGLGKDIMKGGKGNDTYYVDNVGDQVIEYENEGIDTVNSSISYALPDNVENLTLIGTGNINGIGNELDNIIIGNDGDNILDGRAGTNTLKGGKGNDTYIINVLNANDKIIENANEGIDTVRASINYTLGANLENLVLTGENQLVGTGNNLDNYMEGNGKGSKLYGGAGNDTLKAGKGGNDFLYGGAGNDTYIIDNASTVIVENANEGTDTVISSISYTLGNNLENLTLVGVENINGYGNALNNTIIGNDGNNILAGGAGNDILKGGKGSDTYLFNLGDGQDTIIEEGLNTSDVDVVKFGAGITKSNTIFTRQGYDLVITFTGKTEKLTIKNSNLAFESRIERFEFADGTFIDGTELYTMYAASEGGNLYSDVSYLKASSKSSSVDREYYENNQLKSEIFKNDNGDIYLKNYYFETGPLKNKFEYIFDSSNKVTVIKEYMGYYEVNGMIINYYNPPVLTAKTEYTYNAAGQISVEKYYIGTNSVIQKTTNYTYDTNGLMTKAIEYNKATTTINFDTRYTYNTSGKLTQEKTYIGATTNIKTQTDYTYNAQGQLTNQKTIVGYNKLTSYNSSGLIETWTMRTQNNITYTYNAVGQITKQTIEGEYATYETKKFGITTILNYPTWYTRKTSETTYDYNAKGNLTNQKTIVGYIKTVYDFSGKSTEEWAYRTKENITYTYNASGQITKETIEGEYVTCETKQFGSTIVLNYPTWNTRKTSETTYDYDAKGNLTNQKTMVGYIKTIYDFSGKSTEEWTYRTKENITYTYNAAGQITKKTIEGEYATYETKKFGTVTVLNYPTWDSRKTSEMLYVYDTSGRLLDTKLYTYTYNASGVATSTLAENIVYTYDEHGRLTLMKQYQLGVLKEAIKYEYTFDSDGYLIKQSIYKGVISNNNITSYTKIQDVNVNSYYDKLVGSDSNDTLNGSNQNDKLYGGAGNDTLFGNEGDDYLDGGEGADLMVGGKGNDTYVVDNIYDTIIEHKDEGTDTVLSHISYTLGDNLENLTLLGTQNLNGTGNSENNVIIGNDGDNILTGGDGNDILFGGSGNDALYGGNHNDILIGGTGNDLLYGGNGDDTYIFSKNDGIDIVSDSGGNRDCIGFDSSIDKSKIAIFMDGNDLIIDYGEELGKDRITVLGQSISSSTIERFELSDGSYITNYDINQLIQNMTAYAVNNSIEFTNINSVKNNDDLMTLVSNSWHS